jgi:sulfide:quinone oxidoreductase
MSNTQAIPLVVILGGNFAGLGCAQKIHEYCGDAVRISVLDRKNYLLFVPNIPLEVMENRDPEADLRMDLPKALADDDIGFIQAEIEALDVDAKTVVFRPAERPGAEVQRLRYDYLVVALGNRLAFDQIDGFAEHGHSVSDFYHGNRLRDYLFNGGYQGGPIAIGSARFHQGDGADGLQPYPGGSIPRADAACEGPPVEMLTSMVTYLKQRKLGGERITLFTPGEMVAEDAGKTVVKQLLDYATSQGCHYLNQVQDIRRITHDGVEFADGRSLAAELKIIFPDWVAHAFLKGLPIADSAGFIKTTLLMRNPDYPEVFAAGDAAAVTVPKLGAIGHQECDIVGRQIASDVGRLTPDEANRPLQPVVYCIGDMGDGQAFYIRSNSWFGGADEVLEIGRAPYFLKGAYKTQYFKRNGKMPNWGLSFAQLLTEHHISN